MAVALAGAVAEQAVLHHHQGQTAINQNLRLYRLAHVPDLGHGGFKADGGRGQLQILQKVHGSGIVDIQAEVSVDPHTGFPDGGHVAQVAHQGILYPQLPEGSQSLLNLGHFPIVDDPGQGNRQAAPLHQSGSHIGILHENVQGHIEHGGFHIQQGGSQLLPVCDLDGQSRYSLLPLVHGHRLGLADDALLPPCPEGGQLVQHIPAHGIDGRGGNGEAGIHMGANLHAAVGGTAGFCHSGSQGLAGEGHIDGQLRTGPLHLAGAALRVGGR